MSFNASANLRQQLTACKHSSPFQSAPRLARSTHCRGHAATSASKQSPQLPRLAQLAQDTKTLLLPATLALAMSFLQPLGALADATMSTPPPTASTSSATQAASRTVVDIVGGENTVLNEANEQTNRDNDQSKQGEKQQPADASKVFLEVSVDGQSKGRLIIQLASDAPTGTRRFAQLSEGLNGVGYRLSKFDGIAQGFVKNSGQRSLSYDASNTAKVAGGDTVEELEAEMEESKHRHDAGGIVSLIVKDTRQKVSKSKLVAYNGKLIRVEEAQGGESPNGSGFVITTQAAPQLDATNLVVGHVVDGMDIVEQLTKLPTVKSNSNSVFFRAAKTFGDKRADVAEKGFGRPFQKVLVSASGIVDKSS